MKSKTRASIYSNYLSVGNVSNYHDDRLIIEVWNGPGGYYPRLKARTRPGGGRSALIGSNLYMNHLKDSQLKKLYPTLEKEVTLIPTLLDIILRPKGDDNERLAATDRLKLIFKKLRHSLHFCRNFHRHRDRKQVRLEFTLATELPAPRNWMNSFVQDTEMELALFVHVADSRDVFAFVDRLMQEHWTPLQMLLQVPEKQIPKQEVFSASDKTAMLVHGEVIASFYSPIGYRPTILHNIQRRGESREPIHIPLSCLRKPSDLAAVSLGLLYGLDPKLYPVPVGSPYSVTLMTTRRWHRSRVASTSVSGKIRLNQKYLEAIGYMENTMKRYALLGEQAADMEEVVLGLFEEVPLDNLSQLSRQPRLRLLHDCCKVIWELYWAIWKLRINYFLKKKKLPRMEVPTPRNSSQLSTLASNIANHVRLLRQSDPRTRNDEKEPLTNPGTCVYSYTIFTIRPSKIVLLFRNFFVSEPNSPYFEFFPKMMIILTNPNRCLHFSLIIWFSKKMISLRIL